MLRLCTLAVIVVAASGQSAQLRSLQYTKGVTSSNNKDTGSSNADLKASSQSNRKQNTGSSSSSSGGGGADMAVVIPVVIGVLALLGTGAFCVYRKMKAEEKAKEDAKKEAEEKQQKLAELEKEREAELKREKEAERARKGHLKEEELKKQWADSNSSTTAATSREGTKDIPDALAPGWQQVTDPASGRAYYWNQSTGATSWTAPAAPAPTGLPAGWESVNDPASGKPYYFNRSTGVTQWTIPAAV